MTDEQKKLILSELERKVFHHMTQFDKAAVAGHAEIAEYHTGRESAFREVIKMLEQAGEY